MDWELACHEILISRSASVALSFPKFESTGRTFLSTAEAIYSNKVFKLLKRHVPANIFLSFATLTAFNSHLFFLFCNFEAKPERCKAEGKLW